jgi:sporulation protein YlmC with PRC-barrel domain
VNLITIDFETFYEMSVRTPKAVLKPKIIKEKCKEKTQKNTQQNTESNNDDIKYINDALDEPTLAELWMDKADDYEPWRTFGYACSNTFKENGRELFHKFSKKSPKYNEYECNQEYDKLMQWNGTKQITIATIWEWIKKKDVEIFYKLKEDKSFEGVKARFEKNHLKIINKSFFIKECEQGIVIMKRHAIKDSYEHMTYIENITKTDKLGNEYTTKQENCFITKWLKSTTIRVKDDIGIYPPDQVCPKNIYNMWRPFAMERITKFKYNADAVKKIRNHIKILCGNDDNVASYFEKWIGQMIKHPSVKSICPILISKQGAGKGTLVYLMSKMLGEQRILETTNPGRDVWGDFNALMTDAYVVYINEISKKDTIDADGKIKGLITDTTLNINKKGIDPYKIAAYHRFIFTTNTEDPMKTTHDDRRNMIIRSSDELCGNKKQFWRAVSIKSV